MSASSRAAAGASYSPHHYCGALRLAMIGLLIASITASSAEAAPSSGPASSSDKPAVVCNIKVVSDKVKDVSSLEAWKKSYLIDSKTDREKALACWETVVSFQHQDAPPNEYIGGEANVLDPIKTFNVYGYSLCSVAAAEVCQLARVAGLKARGWTINNHCVAEVQWDNAWHMLDASLINYFPKPDGGIAGVAEICQAVQGWLKSHPELAGNDAALREFGFADNKTGWKKGPELLKHCPFYDACGWWPAGTHGWYSTMQEYDGAKNTPFAWESPSSLGYQVNIQLRDGMKLVRNWSNNGLHVNMDAGGGTPSCLKGVTGLGALKYTPAWGDLAPGRVGNGRLEWRPPMASLKGAALSMENVAPRGDTLRVLTDEGPGVMVVRVPSSYVYLTGRMKCKLNIVPNGAYIISFSDNNGLEWKDLARGASSGNVDVTLPVLRRYDYQVRFELQGKGSEMERLTFDHDIQHSQRALPALDKGDNTITFSTGAQEGTVTVEAALSEDSGAGMNYAKFGGAIDGLENFRVKGMRGSITFPVRTPGEMTRIRTGCFYRAWSAEDGFDIEISFDGGKTFKAASMFVRSDNFRYNYVEYDAVPPGTKSAMVRFSGTKKSELRLMSFHINADYKEPNSGFRPVKIKYAWTEGEQEKTKEFVADKPRQTFNIMCLYKPLMKSVTMELVD